MKCPWHLRSIAGLDSTIVESLQTNSKLFKECCSYYSKPLQHVETSEAWPASVAVVKLWFDNWCSGGKKFPCKLNGHKKVHYNSNLFISFFFAHLQSRFRQISIGIIYFTYTTSSIQHIMTTLDKKFHKSKQIYRQCFPHLSLSHNAPFLTHHTK